jgi:hypothetical protein
MKRILGRSIARLHELFISDTQLGHELLKEVLYDFFEILRQ